MPNAFLFFAYMRRYVRIQRFNQWFNTLLETLEAVLSASKSVIFVRYMVQRLERFFSQKNTSCFILCYDRYSESMTRLRKVWMMFKCEQVLGFCLIRCEIATCSKSTKCVGFSVNNTLTNSKLNPRTCSL